MAKKTQSSSPYLNRDDFFKSCRPFGLTYDDISLATEYSEVLPRDTHLEVKLANHLTLSIPMISSDMDTVTESEMAIAMALQGGMGVIHYNMSEEEQVKQVARVKNHVHGLIQDPIKVSPDKTVGEVLDMINLKKCGFSTFPVVDKQGKLLGLLSSTALRKRYSSKKVIAAMVPREKLFTISEKQIEKDPIAVADKFFIQNMGIHKLLVVDVEDRLKGLFTLSDIERIIDDVRLSFRPARDKSFRLVCGCALSVPRDAKGNISKDKFLGHIGNLVREGLDVAAISVAHGHTKGIGEAVSMVRKNFKNLTLVAGNVTSPAAVEFLADAGADIIKVGQGPGSICTTRVVAGIGVPQLTALYECSKAAKKKKVTLLADGGITKSGDIVKALTIADGVICGGLLAGCREAPGKVMEINGKLYKEYRGMGSHEAMKAGSAARYGHDKKNVHAKVSAEGVEALKEVSGSVDAVVSQLVGGVQSGMGYLGAKTLKEHKEKARYIRVTEAGQGESGPHNIIELKRANNKK